MPSSKQRESREQAHSDPKAGHRRQGVSDDNDVDDTPTTSSLPHDGEITVFDEVGGKDHKHKHGAPVNTPTGKSDRSTDVTSNTSRAPSVKSDAPSEPKRSKKHRNLFLHANSSPNLLAAAKPLTITESDEQRHDRLSGDAGSAGSARMSPTLNTKKELSRSVNLPLPGAHKPNKPSKAESRSAETLNKANGRTRPANGGSLHHSNSGRKAGSDALTRSSSLSLPILTRLRNSRKSPADKLPPDVVIVTSVKDTPSPEGETRPAPVPRARYAVLSALSGACGGAEGGGLKLPFPVPERLRTWLSEEASIEGKEIRNTLAVGVAFQLIFTANFAIQNLQSSLHEEGSLGVSALGCLYGTSILSSIFAPTLIGILGAKGCLVLAWICHILYTAAQYHPTWATMVPASILLGLLTGPTWTAQGLYVSACAFSFSKRSEFSPYTVLSRFNGLFFTLYETKNILGNLVSSFVLRDGMGNQTGGIIFKYCGPDDCPDMENVTEMTDPEPWVIDTMLTIYMGLQAMGLVLTIFLVTPLPRSEWVTRVNIRQTITSWFDTLVRTEMVFLVPFMIFQSMQQGILLTEYTKSYISCPIGVHKVGFVMAAYGAVTAVFTFIFSRLAHFTGRYPLFALAASVNAALLGVMLNWTPDEGQEEVIFIFPVVWGVSEAIWQTQTNAMIAVVFPDRKEPAFANYQTWRAVGYTLIFSYHSFLCVSTKLAIGLGFLVVGMILYTAVEVRLRWKARIKIPRLNTDAHTMQAIAMPAARIAARMASLGISLEQPDNRNGQAARGDNAEVKVELEDTAERASKLKVSSASFKSNASSLYLSTPSQHVNGSSVRVSTSSSMRLSASDRDGESLSDFSRQLSVEEGAPPRVASQVTLNGVYLSSDEQAHLDGDRRGYAEEPEVPRRPKRVSQFARSASDLGPRVTKLSLSSDKSSPPPSPREQYDRPQSWHERSFQNEGALKIVWEKDDVFVF